MMIQNHPRIMEIKCKLTNNGFQFNYFVLRYDTLYLLLPAILYFISELFACPDYTSLFLLPLLSLGTVPPITPFPWHCSPYHSFPLALFPLPLLSLGTTHPHPCPVLYALDRNTMKLVQISARPTLSVALPLLKQTTKWKITLVIVSRTL